MPGIASISQFEVVYKQYYIRLCRYAWSFVDDMDAAKDVVSEVFLKFWNERESINLDTVGQYLYKAVRNQSLNWLRKEQGMQKYFEYCKAAETFEADMYLKNMDSRLDEMLRVIGTMPAKTQHVLRQCYVNGLSYKEVATELGITTDGVKKHITKAFALLRSHFNVKKNQSQYLILLSLCI